MSDSAGNARTRVDSAVDALPGVARIAASTWLQSVAWSMGTTARSSRALAHTLTDPHAAGQVVESLAQDVAEASRVVGEVSRAVASGMPLAKAVMQVDLSMARARHSEQQQSQEIEEVEELTLRERGELLLQRSRDVWADHQSHPSYARILDQLAPDEGRVLLLLLVEGPQPSVDVRTGGPVGAMASQLIAPGLSMIGAHAGCRYLDEVPAYLNNLNRLGMVWFSREQVDDPLEYQVLEAQPDVLAAMGTARFTKAVRRSIHLTPFGIDFARTCFLDPAAVPELPAHEDPGAVQGPKA